MKNKFFYYILTLLLTTWSLELSSKSFKESYKYYFGPNLSQNEACLKSLNIAKKNALEKNYEQIDSQTLLQCNQKDNFICEKLENIWSKTNGIIKNLEILNKQVGYDEKFKSNYCKVIVKGIILKATGKLNPKLDFSFKLKKEVVKGKENLKVILSPTKSMYFNIFHITLINNESFSDSIIKKIFPNEFDKNNLFEFTTSIPSSESGYNFSLVFDEQKGHKRNTEFILALGTLEKIIFLDDYKFIDLREKINAIDLGSRIEKIQTIEILKPTN